MPLLIYGSETMSWKEKEISRVWVVQMDNLKRLLGIRRMDRVPNARIKELCGMKKGLGGRIDEVYAGECAGSRSVGRSWKR